MLITVLLVAILTLQLAKPILAKRKAERAAEAAKVLAAKRRERYEFLKAKISERHFAGFRGLVVDFPNFEFDKYDQGAFPSPMYFWVKNQDQKSVLFWDAGRMTAEIGVGRELQDNERMIPDTPGRSRPEGEPEAVNQPVELVSAHESNP